MLFCEEMMRNKLSHCSGLIDEKKNYCSPRTHASCHKIEYCKPHKWAQQGEKLYMATCIRIYVRTYMQLKQIAIYVKQLTNTFMI